MNSDYHFSHHIMSCKEPLENLKYQKLIPDM